MEDFLSTIKQDFPHFIFKTGAKFSFRPPKTIIIGQEKANNKLLLLHELGHAIKGHYTFNEDLARLKLELEAWEEAKKLAKIYHIPYDQDFIEDHLDTYRNWLHQKSTCKKCGSTCYQTPDKIYHCPHCEFYLN